MRVVSVTRTRKELIVHVTFGSHPPNPCRKRIESCRMQLKRPSSTVNSSYAPAQPLLKRRKSGSLSPNLRDNSPPDDSSRVPLKVYIIEAKLDAQTLSELVSIVESRAEHDREPADNTSGTAERLLLELAPDVQQADVVVTAIQMRRRLERHLDSKLAVGSIFYPSLNGPLDLSVIYRVRKS